jgi:dTMP kinase
MRGRFVTFEGPEGSGKSTQIRRLADWLMAQGKEVFCTREPGGTPAGEAIRALLQHDVAGDDLGERAELLLFSASRAQLVDRVIAPALDRGVWVLCDRFFDSTMAYQGFARGMDLEALGQINAFAVQDCRPDLTLLLDLSVEVGFARLKTRYEGSGDAKDRFEREEKAFHERVRHGYLQLAKREPDRFRILNADDSPDAVASSIRVAVQEALFS